MPVSVILIETLSIIRQPTSSGSALNTFYNNTLESYGSVETPNGGSVIFELDSFNLEPEE